MDRSFRTLSRLGARVAGATLEDVTQGDGMGSSLQTQVIWEGRRCELSISACSGPEGTLAITALVPSSFDDPETVVVALHAQRRLFQSLELLK